MDVESFTKLASINLQYDTKGKIVSTKRIGNSDGSKPKRLLTTFTNFQAAADLYTRAPDLRYSHDVYINLNLSREQSRLAFLKRVKRRDPTAISAEVASEVDATRPTDHDDVIATRRCRSYTYLMEVNS